MYGLSIYYWQLLALKAMANVSHISTADIENVDRLGKYYHCY